MRAKNAVGRPFQAVQNGPERPSYVSYLSVGLIAAILLSAFPERSLAGGGPESVAVVVNAESWASLAVANEYVALRQIPESNVVYLAGLPSNLSVDVNQFRDLVLRPMLDTLRTRGLTDQIDCIAYSADLPYSIHVQPDVGQQKLHRVATPEASINGLTYLYQFVLAKDVRYLSMDANAYYRRRLGEPEPARLAPEEQEQLGKVGRLLREKKWAEAEPELRKLAAVQPKSSLIQYDLACCLARLGKTDEAVAALNRAVEAGWLDVRHVQRDPDLASLRARPEVKTLLGKIEATRFDTQPPRAFRNAIAWSPSGEPTTASEGIRYLLSTMLAVTSGRGNSVREAIEGLRRSAAADGTRPAGTVYYLRNGDIRSTTRQWGFTSAAEKLKAMGVRAELIEGVLPKDRRDVAGAMIGAAGFDWKSCGSTILPGAVCEHLTSFGGVMRDAYGQTPLSELLRHGAAGACGTVTEPYAVQAKFPTPFLHVFYASGCNLAEAFYQSVHGPYQLLIVGDPLCQPWAKIPKVKIEGVTSGATVKGRLRLRPRVEGSLRIGRYEIYVDGRRVAAVSPAEELEVPIASLCDGYHEIRVAAVVGDPVETRASTVLPIAVDNRGLSMEIVPPPKTVALDQVITLRAKMPQAKKILVMHNRREVAAIVGPEGAASIPAVRLGLGRVRLQPVAVLKGPDKAPLARETGEGQGVREYLGKPLEVTVTPPTPLPAIKQRPPQLVPGLELRSAGRSVVIERAKDGDWLAKAVKPGQDFLLEGYFDVPADDVYQFQLRASMAVELSVDGRVFPSSDSNRPLQYFPVSLAAGTHRLSIKGRGAEKATLDLYFGGPGAPGVGADRFRHAKAAGPGK